VCGFLILCFTVYKIATPFVLFYFILFYFFELG